jgi:hypothetical protein
MLWGWELDSTGSVGGGGDRSRTQRSAYTYKAGTFSASSGPNGSWWLMPWGTVGVASGLQFAYIMHTRCGHRGGGLHPLHDLLLTSCHGSGVSQGWSNYSPTLIPSTRLTSGRLMRLEVRVFCHVTPCSLIHSWQELGGTCCRLYLTGKAKDISRMFHRNVDKYRPENMGWYITKEQSLSKIKSVRLMVVTHCSSEKARRFGGTYCLHFQGQINQTAYLTLKMEGICSFETSVGSEVKIAKLSVKKHAGDRLRNNWFRQSLPKYSVLIAASSEPPVTIKTEVLD